ncbi:MAG: hypothetical protein ACI8Z5_002256 [Lentimonas sp.]|jgi:hypothetical protein
MISMSKCYLLTLGLLVRLAIVLLSLTEYLHKSALRDEQTTKQIEIIQSGRAKLNLE